MKACGRRRWKKLLRYESPVQVFGRSVRTDSRSRARTCPRGRPSHSLIGAAHRDLGNMPIPTDSTCGDRAIVIWPSAVTRMYASQHAGALEGGCRNRRRDPTLSET